MKSGLFGLLVFFHCVSFAVGQIQSGYTQYRVGTNLPAGYNSIRGQSNFSLFPAKFEKNASFSAACKEIDWTVWNSIGGKAAAGSIQSQGTSVNITMSSAFDLESAPQLWRPEEFRRFKGNMPASMVARTSWSKEPGRKISICFSQSVKEPVLLLASLGSYKDRIQTTISFSQPYTMVFNDGGMIANGNSSITGREGYAIIKFPGDIKCITITSSSYENFTDLTWGIPVCPEGTTVAPKALEPPPVAKPALTTQAEPAVAPPPAPKKIETAPLPKPAPVPTKAESIVSPARPEPEATASLPKPVLPLPKSETPMTSDPEKVQDPSPKPASSVLKSEPLPEAALKPVTRAIDAAAKPAPLNRDPSLPLTKQAPSVIESKAPIKPAANSQLKDPVLSQQAPKNIIAPVPKSGLPARSSIKSVPFPKNTSNRSETLAAKVPDNRLKIEISDYDGVDYDSVSLKFNNKPLGPASMQLQLAGRNGGSQSVFNLDVQPGSNSLEIYALSEGIKPFTTVCLQIHYPEKTKKLYFTLKAKEKALIQL